LPLENSISLYGHISRKILQPPESLFHYYFTGTRMTDLGLVVR